MQMVCVIVMIKVVTHDQSIDKKYISCKHITSPKVCLDSRYIESIPLRWIKINRLEGLNCLNVDWPLAGLQIKSCHFYRKGFL